MYTETELPANFPYRTARQLRKAERKIAATQARKWGWRLKADAIGMAAYYLACANAYVRQAAECRNTYRRRELIGYAKDYYWKSIQDRKLAQQEGWKLP